MEALLRRLKGLLKQHLSEALLKDLESLLRELKEPLSWRIDLETYLVGSTIIAVFLQQPIAHVGIDIYLGYPIIALNSVILLALDRLLVHRGHIILIAAAGGLSFMASRSSGTPLQSVVAQLLGICGFSIYYFTMLTNARISVTRWMEMYLYIATITAALGICEFIYHHLTGEAGDTRLRSIFSEPSFYIYTTLPALGFYFGQWFRHRRYGQELLLFLFTYALAQSILGLFGLVIIAFLTFVPKLTLGRVLLFAAIATGGVGMAFLLSQSIQVRIVDTVLALHRKDLSGVNESTFAFLTNAYVTMKSFLAHPLIGVGLGGYQYSYTQYIIGLSGLDPTFVTINMYDASSLFLRTTAELGAIGLIALLSFFLIFSRVHGEPFTIIRNAILPYLLVRMTRDGAWFSVDVFFFVGIYVLNYLQSRAQFRQDHPSPAGLKAGI